MLKDGGMDLGKHHCGHLYASGVGRGVGKILMHRQCDENPCRAKKAVTEAIGLSASAITSLTCTRC